MKRQTIIVTKRRQTLQRSATRNKCLYARSHTKPMLASRHIRDKRTSIPPYLFSYLPTYCQRRSFVRSLVRWWLSKCITWLWYLEGWVIINYKTNCALRLCGDYGVSTYQSVGLLTGWVIVGCTLHTGLDTPRRKDDDDDDDRPPRARYRQPRGGYDVHHGTWLATITSASFGYSYHTSSRAAVNAGRNG